MSSFVQTDMGNAAADYVGMKEAPTTLDASINGIVKLVSLVSILPYLSEDGGPLIADTTGGRCLPAGNVRPFPQFRRPGDPLVKRACLSQATSGSLSLWNKSRSTLNRLLPLYFAWTNAG